jgi:predicted peptidase
MNHASLALCTLLALALPMKKAAAQESPPQSLKFAGKVSRSVSASYLLYLPQDYQQDTTKRWPLLLFLHGAGERGTDLKKVAVHGPPKLIQSGTNLPFIVVSPQCPEPGRWDDDTLVALLDAIATDYRVKTNQVYLTGLSMGGFGTWSLATKYPERFAAVAPICGGGDLIDIYLTSPEKTKALKSLGIWAFHGAKDNVVPVLESERMVAALKRAGCADLKLTIYPEAQHDSWTEAYNNPELYDWFLKHVR